MIIRIKDDKGKLMGKTVLASKTWTLTQDDMFRNDEAFSIDNLSAGIATICEVMIGGRVVNSCDLTERRKLEAGEGLSFRPGFFAIDFPHAVESEKKTEKKLHDVRNTTIEDCARVAHDWLKHHGYEIEAIEVAAAIRASKDKP